MRSVVRVAIGIVVGMGTALFGQLAIENSAWWLTGGTATFGDPLLNVIKFGLAVSGGIGVGAMIGLAPRRRRRLL